VFLRYNLNGISTWLGVLLSALPEIIIYHPKKVESLELRKMREFHTERDFFDQDKSSDRFALQKEISI
jgi:hypothetical protein